MNSYTISRSTSFGYVFAILVFLLCPVGLRAQLFVDCSGQNQNAYPTINGALQNASSGSTIIVTGTCTENVNLNGWIGLNLGAAYGQTATLVGALSISNSQNIFLYGMNVTKSPVDGVTVSDSTAVFLDSCTSSGNTLNGLRVQSMSDVGLATGAFDNNGSSGIWSNINSLVLLNAWAGPVDISSNFLAGLACEQARCVTFGNTSIRNNGATSGFGVDLIDAGLEFASYYGPNYVEDNTSGGISLRGHATISIFGPSPTVIRKNGPVGVTAGFGSVLGMSNAEIASHTSVGVDVYANSQASLNGNNIHGNGSATDPLSAGIRVDGNSNAYIRTGNVIDNSGPGLLVLVNSSVDFSGLTIAGNKGGIITCDNTAVMVSDLSRASLTPTAGINCKTPHSLGNRQISTLAPRLPDVSAQKALHERYRILTTKH